MWCPSRLSFGSASFFLLYINDLQHVSNLIKLILFADDSNVFFHGKDPNELITIANQQLPLIVEWLATNKLTLNVSKTHYIIFRNVGKTINVNEDLIVAGTPIKQEKFTKFLGVWLDENLNWSKHIKEISKKIARGLGILSKARNYLDRTTMKTLYYSFVYPYLLYNIEVWGNAANRYIEPLFRRQKRAVRIIIGARKHAHTAPIFSELKILKLRELYYFSLQSFM